MPKNYLFEEDRLVDDTIRVFKETGASSVCIQRGKISCRIELNANGHFGGGINGTLVWDQPSLDALAHALYQ